MFHFSFRNARALAAALLLAGPAWAGDGADFGAPVSAAALDAARGGSSNIASDTTLSGTVSANSASHVVSGANTIAASSFAGATGIPIVIQNTGANVLIQNATVINLQFTQ